MVASTVAKRLSMKVYEKLLRTTMVASAVVKRLSAKVYEKLRGKREASTIVKFEMCISPLTYLSFLGGGGSDGGRKNSKVDGCSWWRE